MRKQQDMNKRLIGSTAVGLAVLITSGVVAVGIPGVATAAGASPKGAARAATVIPADAETNLDLSANASYACVGPCASATYFWIDGVARSGLRIFGRVSAVGTVLSVLANSCLVQSENYGLTEQSGPDNGDTIYFSTTKDEICPTNNPNVSIETGSFTITGGTGVFADATGDGTFTWSVLASPQVGSGTLTASVSY